jgi:hypothetical protein
MQYDPILVAGNWGEITITDGAVNGEFFSTTQDNTLWAREFDRDGNGTRVKNNNRGASFQVTLSASSPTNNLLWAAYASDAAGGNQIATMSLVDASGTLQIFAENAFIENVPDVSLGAERGTRVWTFQCTRLDIQRGAHLEVTAG